MTTACDPAANDGAEQRNLRFVRLFTQYRQQIYSYIVSLVPNWADADEVMQDTSTALWEMFDQFEEGTRFASWACRIAYYRVLRFRQQRRRDRHEFSTEFFDLVAQTAQDEIETLEERRRALAKCLDALPPRERSLMEACYSTGETIKAVAEKHGKPVKRLYVALGCIRQALFDCVQRKLAVYGGGGA